MPLALIDYGAGNLTSVRKGLAAVGADVWCPSRPDELQQASGVIVPGVGHFNATASLDEAWRRGILDALANGRPLLGICLGLQWLFEGSTEAPELGGLGVLEGRCSLLRRDGTTGGVATAGPLVTGRLKIPHVGWNTIESLRPSPLLEGVRSGAYAYFTHSYAAPVTPACLATTTYGERFAAIVAQGDVYGVQFHPEKSSEVGLRILRNFAALAGARRA